MRALMAAILSYVLVSLASTELKLNEMNELKKTPLLPHKTKMDIIRNFQEIMRSHAMMTGKPIGEKKLGVVKFFII